MTLKIIRGSGMANGIIADRRLYLTRDGKVSDQPVSGGILLATPGSVIPASECSRLSLALEDGKVVQKMRKPAEDKLAVPDEDKADLTVSELRERAKAQGIEGYHSMKKAELIEALRQE